MDVAVPTHTTTVCALQAPRQACILISLGPSTPNCPNPPLARRWNGYITYQTSGAGSWGEPADSCTPSLYTNGGNGGFIIITATSTTWRSDYYTLGSTYPQCTVPDPAYSSCHLPVIIIQDTGRTLRHGFCLSVSSVWAVHFCPVTKTIQSVVSRGRRADAC